MMKQHCILLLLLCCWSLFLSSVVEAFILPQHKKSSTLSFIRQSKSLHANKQDDNESFDMNELKRRISQITTSGNSVLPNNSFSSDDHHHHDDDSLWTLQQQQKDDDCYVILVQPGTSQQGVHTIEYPKGSGNNVVLAFAQQDAADRFCELLAHQQKDCFAQAAVVHMTWTKLQEFCHELGILAQYVPTGLDLIPPRQSSETFGHVDPMLRGKQEHLEYLFAMEETEIGEEEGLLVLEMAGCWD